MSDSELTPAIKAGLAFIDALNITERRAFLGLFAGASQTVTSNNGDCPMMGKAECERVTDWRDFYGERLPAAGLTTFSTKPPYHPSFAREGWMAQEVDISPTALGCAVREAWWQRLDSGGHDVGTR